MRQEHRVHAAERFDPANERTVETRRIHEDVPRLANNQIARGPVARLGMVAAVIDAVSDEVRKRLSCFGDVVLLLGADRGRGAGEQGHECPQPFVVADGLAMDACLALALRERVGRHPPASIAVDAARIDEEISRGVVF